MTRHKHREYCEADASRDRCPECGGELDTGWECSNCGYDARPLALVWEAQPRFKENETGEYWWFHPTDWRLSPEPQIVLVRMLRGCLRALYLAGGIEKVSEMKGLWAGPVIPPSDTSAFSTMYLYDQKEAEKAWSQFILSGHMLPSRLFRIALMISHPTDKESEHLNGCHKCSSVVTAYKNG